MTKSLRPSISISLTFVIPDVNAFQSGGNIYNKNLITGLEQHGYAIKVMDLAQFKKQSISQLQGYYFFDTLYFTQLDQVFIKKNKQTQFWLIVHHLESLYPPKNWTAANYFLQKEKPLLILFDGFLTSSQFTADYLMKYELGQTKIVIPPAIDFRPAPIIPKSTQPIKALIVANLVERKGILPFLEKLAISTLGQNSNQLQIYLAGSDEIEKAYAQECLTLIAKNQTLNKIIRYQGQLSSTKLYSFYQQANLFVSTAFMETYGMALQEARSFGLPILALQGGNVGAHIKHGSTGFLVYTMDDLLQQLEVLVRQPDLLEQVQQVIRANGATNFYDWKQAGALLLRQLNTSS